MVIAFVILRMTGGSPPVVPPEEEEEEEFPSRLEGLCFLPLVAAPDCNGVPFPFCAGAIVELVEAWAAVVDVAGVVVDMAVKPIGPVVGLI
jgi:hypothetical protein